MYRKYKILAILGIIVTLLSPQLTVIAQEVNSENELSSEIQGLDPSGVRSGELTNCFDTYKFGAEGISLTAGTNLSEYKPSDLVEVVGEIVNNNTYPIIDMTVKARVLRSHVNPVEQRALYTTIEEFILLENVTLKAKESYTLEHIYDLPDNAPTGNYRIQYYVYNQDRFALNGL